ncbi:MAG: C4-dicarboxylate ABC transporter [Gammaproteobacteria bacterium]|jgi:tripartite ATP-independent transporter DctM subunit|nr:C4-dicarboxylate ABC transporter [Gammaproteobacteria bacterium]MBE46604.1 C4-dicarboxylate ABC transporter [Gammaproteobacteria bacterium]MBL15199.1 C4-dicarboxylate ABC transporter [Gammaproteobacteria bacterium]HAC87501.1 C4-dicarboxylate ABC transporter [Gammaproteobacteria bacterium]HAD72523.1 C4-dicarboxylate ABC transporter [Gammaproteobacteria bacterium]|tara:strand:+ start:1293 stop:2624 length:1332 start_codon:yes stop_codon:yes gene_type:complete
MMGYPVALTLAGVSILFAGLGVLSGNFDAAYISLIPNRIYGVLVNQNLFAVPLFVFMGSMLEKSRIAEDLLKNMALVFGRIPGGLGISVIVVGMLLAASTGIVGATVVTMGILSLPTMLNTGYRPSLACGTLCATGTLGQIIPPSICLVLLGEVISNAYQQSQLNQGVFAPDFVSIGDLFAGAIIPGLLLVLAYAAYVFTVALFRPHDVPQVELDHTKLTKSEIGFALMKGLLPPVLLMIAVLGSILVGIATPTEAAGVGALGAILLALAKRELNVKVLHEVAIATTRITSMVYLILVGATIFSSVFRGFGGDLLIEQLLTDLPGGVIAATVIVMLVIFLLGFILDFIEITFMVVPLVGPILLAMGLNPIWLGVIIAVNLQTSFLTPPFGFSLFYLRSVAPDTITTGEIYRGVIPFVIIQLGLMLLLALQPGLVTWLPSVINP